MNRQNNTRLPLVQCPSCKQHSPELEWNMFTSNIVKGLNGDNSYPIRFYIHRVEGTLYRCPKCEDELVTDNNKILRVQDENGLPIIQ